MRSLNKIVRCIAIAFFAILSINSFATTFITQTSSSNTPKLDTNLSENIRMYRDRLDVKQKKRFILLNNGVNSAPEDFPVEAHISFKDYKRQVVSDKWSFQVQSLALEQFEEGWGLEKSFFFWRNIKSPNTLAQIIQLKPQVSINQPKLSEFDEFWIDYGVSSNISACSLAIKFDASIFPFNSKFQKPIILNSGFNDVGETSIKEIIDLSGAIWKERNYSYLMGRLLQNEPDSDWRYTKDQKNIVLQRRLHVPVEDTEILDIAIEPNIVVERVNLMVSRKDDYSRGELVEFDSPQIIFLPDGGKLIRLNLAKALKERFTKEWQENSITQVKNNFYLQEIFTFVNEGTWDISKNAPLKSLIFRGADAKANMPHKDIRIHPDLQRRIIDLRKVARDGEINLNSAQLILLPPKGVSSCAISIQSMQAVKTNSENAPIFSRMVEEFSNRWGVIFNSAIPRSGLVDVPKVVGFLPFAVLSQNMAKESTSKGRLKPNENNLYQGVSNRAVLSAGAVHLTNPAVDILRLEGHSKPLEFSWPFNAEVNSETWFYLGMPKGDGSITLTLSLADGSVVKRQVKPNEPLQLFKSKMSVKNIKLRIIPASSPYSFDFREMVFFEPASVSYSQAFTHPLPEMFDLVPVINLKTAQDFVLEIWPGRISGLVTKKPILFYTALNPVFDWVAGLHLKYSLPQVYRTSDGCALSLQLNWENGKTKREICFDKPLGDLYLPIGNLLSGENNPQDLGRLISVDWSLNASSLDKQGVLESYSLEFSFHGWIMESSADHLIRSPIFYSDNRPVYIDSESAKKMIGGGYARKLRLKLDDNELQKIVAGKYIDAVENPIFTLNRLIADSGQPLTLSHKLKATEVGLISPISWTSKLLIFFLIIFMASVIWRGRWLEFHKIINFGNRVAKFLRRKLNWIYGTLSHWFYQLIPNIHLGISLLALGPGLFLAGYYGLTFVGFMLFTTCALFVLGGYYHWQSPKWLYQPKSALVTRMQFGALALTLGCAVWSLGLYQLNSRALWGFLPLLGMGYILFPLIYRKVRAYSLSHFKYFLISCLLIMAALLYGSGLLVREEFKNYFFMCGGLITVFVLRTSILVLELRLNKICPIVARHIYGASGGLYFAGALLMIVAIIIALSLKLESIATQLGMIAYISLMFGVAHKVLALFKQGDMTASSSNGEKDHS